MDNIVVTVNGHGFTSFAEAATLAERLSEPVITVPEPAFDVLVGLNGKGQYYLRAFLASVLRTGAPSAEEQAFWANTAEESANNAIEARIEVPNWRTMSGVAESFIIPDDGLDTIVVTL